MSGSKDIKSIEDLTPDPDNLNAGTERGEYMLGRSLEELGAGRSVVADKDGVMIAGNHVLEKAAELGLDVIVVPSDGTALVVVQRTDLDMSEPLGPARMMAIADNRASEIGLEWDGERLQALAEYEGGLEALGDWFTMNELDDLDIQLNALGDDAKEAAAGAAGAGEDERAEFAEKWGTVYGQLWALGDHKMIIADMTEPETIKRLLGGVLAAGAFTDPPYAIYGSSHGITNDVADNSMVKPFFKIILQTLQRTVAGFGHIYVCCDWRSYPTWSEVSASIRLPVSNMIVWDKGDDGLGSMYQNAHELLIFMSNDPVKSVAMTADKATGKRLVTGDVNIWRYPRVTGEERLHNAAKPLEMIERALSNSTKIGEMVVDYFLGSGTTIRAAHEIGRRCYGAEKSPEWAAVTLEAFERATGITPELLEEAKA